MPTSENKGDGGRASEATVLCDYLLVVSCDVWNQLSKTAFLFLLATSD